MNIGIFNIFIILKLLILLFKGDSYFDHWDNFGFQTDFVLD
jgi:hypothetical protein